MSDLLQELMNDVRADRAEELWNKHGRWVIYTAIAIVLVTAAVVYRNHATRTDAMRETALYIEASDALAKGEAQAALANLAKISVSEKSDFHGLVLLKTYEAQVAMKQPGEAEKTLTALAARPDVYGDIGKVLQRGETVQGEAGKAALPFTREEWAAWDLVAAKQETRAAGAFGALAAKENIPVSMRERALMMAGYLKNKSGQ